MEKYEGSASATSIKKLEIQVAADEGCNISTNTSSELTSPTVSADGGLVRQGSMTKCSNCCLCSPTTQAGSFRCRLHRVPSLQRTKSIDSSHQSRPITSATSIHDSVTVDPSSQ